MKTLKIPRRQYALSSGLGVSRALAHVIRSSTLKFSKGQPCRALTGMLVIAWTSCSRDLLSPSRRPSEEKHSTDSRAISS